MSLIELTKKRKSVRAFSKRSVDWRVAMDAIDAALQGPFSGNVMNLKFLIIEDPKIIQQLATAAEQTWISQSPLLITVCSSDTFVEASYGERGRIYSRQQTGAAIQTILLALTEKNIASCWIGAYSDDKIREILQIPQDMQIEALIPCGYEDKKNSQSKKEKKSLESAIFWEHWGNDRRPSLFEENLNGEEYRPQAIG